MSNVLIVDDSAVDRLLFKSLVEASGRFTVIESSNASEALEKLAAREIDIIVTDMQMPEMDGLQLLGLLQQNYPDIPTILATGMGSSDLAAEALSQGAAGYVPKARLSELLVPTIDNLLDRKIQSGSFARLLDSSREIRFHFSLENDPALFAPLIDLVAKMVGGMSPLGTVDQLRIGVAIEQALHNALYRGNLALPFGVQVPFGDELPSPDTRKLIEQQLNDPNSRDRKIDVLVEIQPGQLVCRIADEGSGFRPDEFSDSPSAESGRGLALIRSFMDRVEFNDQGNQITLTVEWVSQTVEDLSADPGAAATELGCLNCKDSSVRISLQQAKYVVGAHRSSHLIIRDRSVAKHHSVLIHQQGQWYVKDLDSETGTLVNGKRVKQVQLQPGDMIKIGPREFHIEF